MSRFYAELLFDNEVQRQAQEAPYEDRNKVTLESLCNRYFQRRHYLELARKARKFSAKLTSIGIGLQSAKSEILGELPEKITTLGVSLPVEKIASVGMTSILTIGGFTLALEQIKVMDERNRMKNIGRNATHFAQDNSMPVPDWAILETGDDMTIY